MRAIILTILHALERRAAEIVEPMIFTGLLWALVTLAVCMGLVILTHSRRGLGEGRRATWLLVALILDLTLVTLPLVSLPLGARAGAMKAVELVDEEADAADLTKVSGMALLLPLMLDYTAKPEQQVLLRRAKGGQVDLQFLLDDDARRAAVAKLDPARVDRIYHELRASIRLPDDLPVPQWALDAAADEIQAVLVDDISRYDALTADLTPEPDGSLPIESAAYQVGRTFLSGHMAPITDQVLRPYIIASIGLGLGQFLLLLGVLVMLTRRAREAPATESARAV